VSGIPWDDIAAAGDDHIILFFHAHLALTIVWSNNLEASLPLSLSGTEFADWDATWLRASFSTGSSRHFTLQYEGVGDKTIQIFSSAVRFLARLQSLRRQLNLK